MTDESMASGRVFGAPGLTLHEKVAGPTKLVFPGMFTVLPGGVIELEGDTTLDEASAAFWQMVSDTAPSLLIEDPKRRGPAYERGRADGRLQALAGTADLTPILRARSGMAEPVAELEGIASDSVHDTDRTRLLRIAAAIRGEPDPTVPEETEHG